LTLSVGLGEKLFDFVVTHQLSKFIQNLSEIVHTNPPLSYEKVLRQNSKTNQEITLLQRKRNEFLLHFHFHFFFFFFVKKTKKSHKKQKESEVKYMKTKKQQFE